MVEVDPKPPIGVIIFSFVGATLFSFRSSSSLGALEPGPKPKLNFAAAVAPNVNLVDVADVLSVLVAPGLGCSQHAHLVRSASFRVIQASHSHLEAFCCAAMLLKPASDVVAGVVAEACAGANPNLKVVED